MTQADQIVLRLERPARAGRPLGCGGRAEAGKPQRTDATKETECPADIWFKAKPLKKLAVLFARCDLSWACGASRSVILTVHGSAASFTQTLLAKTNDIGHRRPAGVLNP